MLFSSFEDNQNQKNMSGGKISTDVLFSSYTSWVVHFSSSEEKYALLLPPGQEETRLK